jgi:putative transcriptional regulator
VLADIEKGCLLLANPALFAGDTSQPYFSRAVIFLFESSPDGAVGIILNRRTERKLGEIRGAEPFTPEFASAPLYLGGDVGAASMHLLHRDNPEALPSGKTVVRGVAMGGFRDAVAAVRSGAMRAQDFRFFSRYCGWGPGQLESEVAAGVWFVAAASADLVLAQPPDPALRPGQEQAALPPSRSGGLWAEVLTLMGGEYAEMARATLDAES